MLIRRSDFFALLFILITTLISIKAFAIPGLYTSHDGETHTARLANYYLALKEGQMPPQLAPTLFGGYGFPIFIFIYPLPYAVGSLFHFLGFSYSDSTELTMALGQVLSAIFIYIFFKLETKNTLASVVSALFFTWAPYRFLMLFVRGAFAESFAYIFISTSLVGLNRLLERPSLKWMGLTSLSLAGLLLSHQLVSVMFLPVLTFYCITKLMVKKQDKVHSLFFAFCSLALAFGISAFIYFPAVLERKLLRFDELINYYLDHFVTIKQLIRSPWSYGFSHPGTINDDMSFQIGLTQLAVVIISLSVLALSIWHRGGKAFKSRETLCIFLWLVVFFLSCFVMIEHPLPKLAWKYIPGLGIVDFPWRFLGVATFSVSMLVAYLLKKTNNHILIVVFLVFFVFYANRNHTRINEPMLRDDRYFNEYPATATWRNEFLPRVRVSNQWQGIEGDYQIWKGEGIINEIDNRTHKLDLKVASKEAVTLLLHRLYFPGWQVFIDGKEQQFDSSSFKVMDSNTDVNTVIDYSGFLLITVPAGDHSVTAQFSTTSIRQTGRIVSLGSLLLAVGLAVVPLSKLSLRKLRIDK